MRYEIQEIRPDIFVRYPEGRKERPFLAINLDPCANVQEAIRRSERHLIEQTGCVAGNKIILGIDSYWDLVMELSRLPICQKFAPDEYGGMTIVVDPTRSRFVCVVPKASSSSDR